MTADKLYDKLNQMFSSAHNDTRAQINESIVLLERAFMDGFTPDVIIEKMNFMLEANSETRYKSKLSTAILNKFWERHYEKPKDLFRPLRIDE